MEKFEFFRETEDYYKFVEDCEVLNLRFNRFSLNYLL